MQRRCDAGSAAAAGRSLSGVLGKCSLCPPPLGRCTRACCPEQAPAHPNVTTTTTHHTDTGPHPNLSHTFSACLVAASFPVLAQVGVCGG